MPTFDRLAFLPPAVESVFAQTFGDWELIVADDGSGTQTREYLRSLHDPRVKLLWLAHSGKPAIALNSALRIARGAYVAFLDSDDVWRPRKLEMQLASLRRHPQCHWSCTAFELIDSAGARLPPPRIALWPAASGWVRDHLFTDAVIAMPSVLVARHLLEKVGPLDEDLVMCYDNELWLRLAAHSELDGIPEPLTLVRRHGSHGGSDVIAWRDRRRVVEKAMLRAEDAHFRDILHAQRAVMSAGLAASYAASGQRISALRTLAASAPYSWRYGRWWSGALATARAYVPRALRRAVRALRT